MQLMHLLSGYTPANAILDIAIVMVILTFTMASMRRGFIDSFFSVVSGIAAAVVAVMLAAPLITWTNGLFGVEKIFSDVFVEAFSKVKGFDIDVSAAGIEAALQGKNLPAFLVDSLKGIGLADVPIGTTLALLVGTKMASYVTSLVAGAILFAACKLALKLVEKTLSAIASRLTLIDRLNSLLGALIGFIKGFFIVCAVLAVVAMIPSLTKGTLFQTGLIATWLYNKNPIHAIFSLFLK